MVSEDTTLKLRVGERIIPLADGEYVLGRAADCDIILDDSDASRRHARVVVRDQAVVIEDLASRNGVLVNQVRVFDPTELRPGDRVMLGGTNVVLTATSFGLEGPLRAQPPVSEVLERASISSALTDRRSVYAVLVEGCDRALADGEISDAEFATSSLFMSIEGGVRRGVLADDDDVANVTRLALRLALVTGRRRWLDRLVDVHTKLHRVVSEEVVLRIESLPFWPSRAIVVAHLRAFEGDSHEPTLAEAAVLERFGLLLEN